jgi:hypothetical protein
MGKDSGNRPDQPLAQNQNDIEGNAQDKAMSGDPADGQGVSDTRRIIGRAPVERAPANELQNQATIEEFGEEGLGVAPKE